MALVPQICATKLISTSKTLILVGLSLNLVGLDLNLADGGFEKSGFRRKKGVFYKKCYKKRLLTFETAYIFIRNYSLPFSVSIWAVAVMIW